MAQCRRLDAILGDEFAVGRSLDCYPSATDGSLTLFIQSTESQCMFILKLLTLILGIPALSTLPAKSSTTQPDFPVTETRWFMFHKEYSPAIRFTVPDEDTTQSAYGGTLRRYDVHLAKMFEVTHFLCTQRDDIQWIDWFYEAVDGKVNMGHFKIKCSLAKDIAIAYGLDRSEQTTIKREFEGDASNSYETKVPSTQHSVPVLNLRGNKITRWMDFVQEFRPDYTIALANSQIPIQQMLEPLRGKIPVPIFLPDHWSDSDAVYVSLKTGKDGYSAYFTTLMGCKTATVCYVGSVSASRNGKLRTPPLDSGIWFKHVQLSYGIKGAASGSCGATCMARVQWEEQGVVYEVHGKRVISTLIDVANNAIEAGVR